MSAIEIISASAGSGKTYRIAQTLEQEVVSGRVRPEAILATTFTNKAAAELRERVRANLLSRDRVADAQRLATARIGTVNAVCGRIVSDFAFELGLSPDLRVLDETLAAVTVNRTISQVVDAGEVRELAALGYRFESWSWQKDVQRVIDFARANGIAATALKDCAARSIIGCISLLGQPTQVGEGELENRLKHALATFLDSVDVETDKTKDTRTAVRVATQCVGRLRRSLSLPWSDWATLADLKTGAKSRDVIAPVRDAASLHDRHPQLHDDVKRAITLVFDIAARTLDAYQRRKVEIGAIDFVDQEARALEALSTPEIRDRLREELDLVLVDEFHDTSPIQLAIFLELGQIAKRSVWVGDQKQSIYGFRGTDPALMDAVVKSLLGDSEPETLPNSYRSRSELVKVTSELFGRAFASQGFPVSRVHLEPARPDDDLGAVAEVWSLKTTNQPNDARALASLVRSYLADEDVRVEDRTTKQARPVRPNDIAILCRKNDTCRAVAHELEALGIRAELPRTGLLATVEAQLALSGLRLWVDPRDTLAAATVTRLAEYADQPDAWLERVLANPGPAAFAESGLVAAVGVARGARPLLGPVAVFDAVVEALQLREICLRWGDSDARLGNLDALRSYAVAYEQSAATEGRGSATAGFVAFLEELATAGEDHQAVLAAEDAVILSTWHAAKGLEWPVTILFELSTLWGGKALGVQVVSDRERIDLADPLADRWIRFWPWPYGRKQKGIPLVTRLEEHPATQTAHDLELRQQLRLLYVGWTRARDHLVLATRPGKLTSGILGLLSDDDGTLLTEPTGSTVVWGGHELEVGVREGKPEEPVERETEPGWGYVAAGPNEFLRAFVAPSSLSADGDVGEPETIGPRIVLTSRPDEIHLGEAVHGFFAADNPNLPTDQRRSMADGLLQRWGVDGALTADSLISAVDAFRSWVDARWPGAKWHREWPLHHRLLDGSVVRGIADLVVETDTGFAVIDHKAFPGKRDVAVERAVDYAGQLLCYSRAIEAATQKTVESCFIHYPVIGMLVPVTAAGATALSGEKDGESRCRVDR